MTALPRPSSLFRAALARDRGPALGTWIKLPGTEVVELACLAGFDFVVIDLEHAPTSVETASRQIAAALFGGVAPIVRVPGLDAGLVQRILDAGAEGIMVPHVDTVEQAAAAVSASRFPPYGTRGVGSTSRAGGWGAVHRAEYLRYGNEEVVVIAQLESRQAAENAAAIGAVPGLDALLVGAADLSTSEGRTESDPVIVDLIAGAISAARATGLPIGNAGGATEDSVRAAIEAGYSFTLLSNDASLLREAATAAVAAGRAAGTASG